MSSNTYIKKEYLVSISKFNRSDLKKYSEYNKLIKFKKNNCELNLDLIETLMEAFFNMLLNFGVVFFF